ncbi:hypothetical protein DFH06DRAFT_1255476 [Mycena polygramma]|nr:hypothetical protein DFH06DRAFT_1255476 [Mycena polygramma]
MAHVLLRQLLPKPTSLAQPEPFLLKVGPTSLGKLLAQNTQPTSTSTSTSVPGCNVPSKCMDSKATAAKSSEHHRRSSAQQRRRERLSPRKYQACGMASESSKLCRSAAQRARRQRELAAAIERDLQSTTPQYEYDPKVRSKAQKLRRRLEDAQRRLEINPDCGTCNCRHPRAH